MLCRWLNRNLGTTIKPWEMEQLPSVWLDLIMTGLNLEASVKRLSE